MKQSAPLDTALVGQAIASQFPQLGPARVAFLGAGCDSWAYEINDRFVFKFPERHDVEHQLLIESRVLPVLCEESPIPLPNPRFQGRPSSAFPRHFIGYAKLAGSPAITADPTAVSFGSLAPKIASFLSWLHTRPKNRFLSLGVECEDFGALVDEIKAEALENFEQVSKLAPDAPLDEWYAFVSTGPRRFSCDPDVSTMVHNDLAAEHVLLDDAATTVMGVIDWTDMRIGDPGIDFAGLFHWGGEAFLNMVLSAYDGPTRDGVVEIARYLAACRGIADIVFGGDRDRREYVAAGMRALECAASR